MISGLSSLADLYRVDDPFLLWGLVVPVLLFACGLVVLALLPARTSDRTRAAVASLGLAIVPIMTVFCGFVWEALSAGDLLGALTQALIGIACSWFAWSRRGRDWAHVTTLSGAGQTTEVHSIRKGVAVLFTLILIAYALWTLLG